MLVISLLGALGKGDLDKEVWLGGPCFGWLNIGNLLVCSVAQGASVWEA